MAIDAILLDKKVDTKLPDYLEALKPWEWLDNDTSVGDENWWMNLAYWLDSSTPEERTTCIGKTKKISLSTPVLGANKILMRCIGADQDGTGTLTFHAVSTCPDSTVFSDSSPAWIDSTARTQCQNIYNYCSAKSAIKTVSKGTCPDTTTGHSRNDSVAYNNETVFLLSERECGLDSYSPISIANSTTSKAECTNGYNASYSYYTSNTTRKKYKGTAEGEATSTAAYYWDRSRGYNYSSAVCGVSDSGDANSYGWGNHYGLAPAFVIGALEKTEGAIADHLVDNDIHVSADEKSFIKNLSDSAISKTVDIVLPLVKQWASIAYGNGKFVATSYNSNLIVYSTNGVDWAVAEIPFSSKWDSVTYGNGMFIAVSGIYGRAAYSMDGINWTQITSPSDLFWSTVAYGNDMFVGVSGSGRYLTGYSIDGINWTVAETHFDESLTRIAYGNGKFVANKGSSGKAAYSTDGVNWTETTLPSITNWMFATYGDDKFVGVAYNSSTAVYSTDGINWIASAMPSSANWYSVTYGDGKFVTVATNSNKAAYSIDGIHWTATTLPLSANWYSVTYGDGKFIAVAYNSNKVAYSIDGINWIDQKEYITFPENEDTINRITSLTPKKIVATITSASWTGDEAPYYTTLSVTGMTANSDGSINIASNSTAEQRAAVRGALIEVYSQGTNELTLVADGDKPEVDIPVVVTIGG